MPQPGDWNPELGAVPPTNLKIAFVLDISLTLAAMYYLLA
jgi:hypothetical protein